MKRPVIPDSFTIKKRTFSGLHALDAFDAERLYLGLTHYGKSCGCNEGMVGVLLSVFLYFLFAFCLPLLLNNPVIIQWYWGLLIALSGGVLGKCIGLWRAHHIYNKLQKEFDSLIGNQSTGIAVLSS